MTNNVSREEYNADIARLELKIDVLTEQVNKTKIKAYQWVISNVVTFSGGIATALILHFLHLV